MTPKKASRKRSNVRNAPEDHFISAVAHHIEEAMVHLHSITHYHSDELPPEEVRHIGKIKRHLVVLHRLETKRRRDPDAQDS